MADSTTSPAINMTAAPTANQTNASMVQSGNFTFANGSSGSAGVNAYTGSGTPISVDALSKGGSNPIKNPQAQPYNSPNISVAPPQGSVVGENGMATNPPTPTTDATTGKTSTVDYLKNLLSFSNTKPDVQAQLESDNAVQAKKAQSTADYNAYQQAKIDQTNQIAQMHATNPEGMTLSGKQAQIAEYQRTSDAHISNLAIQSQISQGNYTAAQDTVTKKLDSMFSPIATDVSLINAIATQGNNDMTESEKFKMQQLADQKKTDSANVQKAAADIHDALLKAGATSSAYSAVDKITNDYVTGKIDSATAQSQMYAAASKYTGGSATSTTYTVGANPVVDSHIANILNGNETMAQVPAGIRNAVSVGLNSQPAASYSPLAASRLTIASSRITNQFTNMAAYKLTADGGVYLDRINAAIQTPGSVSDQDLLDSLTKLNTGGNAVTDAQVKLITEGKSWSDTVSTWGNKLKNGGVLSDNQRQQITKIANDIFKNYQKSYEPIYKAASAQLTAAGIPKAFWTIPDLNTLSVNGNATENGGSAQTTITPQNTTISGLTVTVPGGTMTFKDQATLDQFKKDNKL